MGEIKMDVQRMVKRRKDSGFTLIELMIVIAVIGILAVVLVPKVGAIKSSAKNAGVDVNVRTVQAYAESQITKWSNANSDQTAVDADISSAMTGGNNPLINPATNTTANAFVSGGASTVGGSVYAVVSQNVTPSSYKVTISSKDVTNNAYKSVDVKP